MTTLNSGHEHASYAPYPYSRTGAEPSRRSPRRYATVTGIMVPSAAGALIRSLTYPAGS